MTTVIWEKNQESYQILFACMHVSACEREMQRMCEERGKRGFRVINVQIASVNAQLSNPTGFHTIWSAKVPQHLSTRSVNPRKWQQPTTTVHHICSDMQLPETSTRCQASSLNVLK